MSSNRKIRKEPLKVGDNPNEWTFEKHDYDLDIIEVYQNLKKLLYNSTDLKANIDKEEHLNSFKYSIECYCKPRKIDFNFHFNFGNLVIPSREPYYEYSLGMALICYDLYKIRSFLNYQKKKYTGENNFVDLVEFGAYDILKNKSPFSGCGERLIAIMNWVEEERNKQEEKLSQEIKKPVTYKENIKQKPPVVESFEELFTDQSQIESIIRILKKHDIVYKDGSWKGTTRKKSEILALIEVLREKRYLKKDQQTLTAELFCRKFGLKLSDRALRTKTQTFYDNLIEYRRIIPDLKF